ncbi:MAG: hypothetical protein ACI909_002060 [Planctomycetota bacterium]
MGTVNQPRLRATIKVLVKTVDSKINTKNHKTTMKKILLTFILLMSLPLFAGPDEEQRLIALFDKIWDFEMLSDPTYATYIGYPGQNAKWQDVSLDAVDQRDRKWQELLVDLRAIKVDELEDDASFNWMLVEKYLSDKVAGNAFPEEYILIQALGGVQQDIAQTLEMMPKRTRQDFLDRLARLDLADELISQTIRVLQEGLKKGVTPPGVTLRDIPNQIRNVIPEKVADSSLLSSFTDYPSDISEDEQIRINQKAASIVRNDIYPAFLKLLAFIEKEYIPKSVSSIAMLDLPFGRDWYHHRVRHFTTLTMTPEQIHKLGLSEVKRIRSEMDKVIADSGFQGSFADFTEFLRSDPQFFVDTPEELMRRYRDIAKRADPELAKLFGTLPRLPYGVIPIPDYAAKSQTTAYYWGGSSKDGRPGYFFANTYALNTRPIWEMEALTLHEAVPGHHLQITLAQELPESHPLLQNLDYTGFIEGWGLYSESLGEEMGFYTNPYSKFGQLTYEMWRAVRLVVDTGMHLYGWDRQRAIDFFAANTAKTLHDIEVEIDRYIAWPGQALAYKLGELKIKQLRALASEELGEKFDIREFHDQVLGKGALPLDVLERGINQWIKARKEKSKTD